MSLPVEMVATPDPKATVVTDPLVMAGTRELSRETAFQPLPIPASMWSKHKEAIRHYISTEYNNAKLERDGFFRDVARWKTLYAAPVELNSGNYPIANASNVTVPMIKEIVNTLVGQLVQSTMTATPRWVLNDLAPEWKPFVDPIERFMNAAAERELEYDETMINAIVEMAKIGTSIVEVAHETELVRTWKYTAEGHGVFPDAILKRDGPITREVPLQNFWIRMADTEIQKARWVAKEFWVNENELRQMEAQGLITGVDDLLRYLQRMDKDDDVLEAEEKLSNTDEKRWSKYRLFEWHLRWDIDDDPNGLAEDIVIYYHRLSGRIIGGHFAKYWHGVRPFVKFGYFPRPHRFYDEGLAEMLEQVQIAVTSIQNKRADNQAMANLKMFIKRKSMKGLMPGDPLYPGKIIETSDIWNDLREFQMAEIYPSTINEEQILRGYAERLSGFNDAVAGAAQPVSRTTATAQLALLQEQARRLDLTIRAIRSGQREIGMMVAGLYSQYGTNGKAIAWLGQPGKAVEAIFSLPRRVQEIGAGIRVGVPTSTNNKQVKRENAIQLFNLMNQMYQQMLPLMAQLSGPEAMAPIVREVVSNAKRFMAETLESFDTNDPETLLSGLTLMEQILPNARDLGGLGDFERAEATAQILDGVARVEDLLREAEGASDRGPGLLGGDRGASSGAENPGTVERNLASLFLGGGLNLNGGGTGGPQG